MHYCIISCIWKPHSMLLSPLTRYCKCKKRTFQFPWSNWKTVMNTDLRAMILNGRFYLLETLDQIGRFFEEFPLCWFYPFSSTTPRGEIENTLMKGPWWPAGRIFSCARRLFALKNDLGSGRWWWNFLPSGKIVCVCHAGSPRYSAMKDLWSWWWIQVDGRIIQHPHYNKHYPVFENCCSR